MKILEGFRPRLIGLASTALVVAGCGGSANDDLPLITASVSIKNIAMGGECDTIPVRMVPKTLDEKANKYANARQMVLEVPTEGPTDENGAPMCNGSAETLPLHTGTWEFSAPLRSDTARCERNIQADGDRNIIFIDAVEGCEGAPAQPEPAAEVMATEEAGSEGAETP